MLLCVEEYLAGRPLGHQQVRVITQPLSTSGYTQKE